MTIRLAAPAAVLLSALAFPAHAGAPEDTATAKADGPGIVVSGQADPKQRKVCHTEVPTGSVMPKRICRTVAEAELEHEQSLRDFDRVRDRQLAGQQVMGQR